MVPRANWKGYLRLSLVSCPIALYPGAAQIPRCEPASHGFHKVHNRLSKFQRVRSVKIDELLRVSA